MSGLVGYESSSSDEEAALKSPAQTVTLLEVHGDLSSVPATTGHASSSKEQVTPGLGASSTEDMIGPMLGPAVQPNGAAAAEEEEASSPIVPANISERDAIRQLTQPTVPATSLPPSPPGSPDPAANERFRRFLELKARGVHFNEDLARKASFRNPSLLSIMLSKVGIDEKAQYKTSLPLDLWDPIDFPEWAYKEGLLMSQQELQIQSEADKKKLSLAGKRTIEFTSETASGGSSRKSTPGQHNKRRRP